MQSDSQVEKDFSWAYLENGTEGTAVLCGMDLMQAGHNFLLCNWAAFERTDKGAVPLTYIRAKTKHRPFYT